MEQPVEEVNADEAKMSLSVAKTGVGRPSTSIPNSFKSELYFLITKFLESEASTASVAEMLKLKLNEEKLLNPR